LLLIVELSLLVIDVKRFDACGVLFIFVSNDMVCAKKGLVQKEGDNASSFEFTNTDSSVEKVATPILYYLCLVKQNFGSDHFFTSETSLSPLFTKDLH
jgi:hypothetical protein